MGHRLAGDGRSPHPLLLALGLAACLIAALETALLAAAPVESNWAHALTPAVGLVYCLTSLIAWSRRPSNRTCALLSFGGLAWFAAALAWTAEPALIAIGQLLSLLPVALTIHLLLAFPSGRVATRLDRVAVLAAYAVALPLLLPSYLCGDRAAPYDVLQLVDAPAVVTVFDALRSLLAWAISVAIVICLRRRLRAAGEQQRRALRPFAAYGLLALIVIPLVTNLLPLFLPIGDPAVTAAQLVVLAGVPVAAVATMLRGGFGRTGAIEELAARLGAGQRTDLREALARTLGDPSLGLSFRLPDGSLVDGAGVPTVAGGGEPGRGVHELTVAGHRVAAIDFDPTAVEDAGDVETAARVVALWIERERLTAALLANDAELRRSRVRVIEAGDRARARIAQDLHDGLGSRLVLIGMQLDAALAGGASDPRAELGALRAELAAASAELRNLAHGVMPPGLVEHGLEAALEEMAARAPLPVSLSCEGVGAIGPELEATVYFVVAEALANAVKHAGASGVEISVRAASEALAIEVRDDGVGGAAPGGGAGVRGMADRVEAYGGELAVENPAAGGVAIHARLPLLGEAGEARWRARPTTGAAERR